MFVFVLCSVLLNVNPVLESIEAPNVQHVSCGTSRRFARDVAVVVNEERILHSFHEQHRTVTIVGREHSAPLLSFRTELPPPLLSCHLQIVYDSQVISHAASASPSAIPETRSSASSTLATPTDATPPSASAAVAAAGTERCHRSFPARMWVRQRQDDAIFLIPEASSATGDVAGSSPVVSTNDHGIVVTIPRDDEEEEEEAPSAWGGNDAELVNIEAAAVGTNVPGDFKGSDVTYDAGRSLRGNAGDGLWAFATGRWAM